MKIAFVHPDLGIGGAERFTVDAAVGLQTLGHDIVIYTSHCDLDHCFEEIKKGIVQVKVRGNGIPMKIFGKFSILCAIFRQFYLSICLFLERGVYDVIIMDLLPFSAPLLQKKCLKLLFYCHFPDKLLARRDSFLRKVYRFPFDWIEERTLLAADRIFVNSRFTASIVREAFPNIKDLTILYPSINTNQEVVFNELLLVRQSYLHLILSINRFERKKNIGLAIRSYYSLKGISSTSKCCLVIAGMQGGYESRVEENVQYHNELVDLCNRLSLKSKTFQHPYLFPLDFSGYEVIFLLSISTTFKNHLLREASILLYTPPYEHFGIVPLEAMLHRTIVLAQNNGGPLETIDDGVSGWLKKPDDNEWACTLENALFKLTDDERAAMGERGRQKVINFFSRENMAKTLESYILETNRLQSVNFLPFFIVIIYLRITGDVSEMRTNKHEVFPVHQDEHPLSPALNESLGFMINLEEQNKVNYVVKTEENKSSKPLFSRFRSSSSFFSGKNEVKTVNKAYSTKISSNHVFNHIPLFDECYDQIPGNIHLECDSSIQRLIDRYGAINFIRQLARDLALRDVQVIESQRQSKDREIVLKKMLLSVGVTYLDIERYLHDSCEKSQESLFTDNLNNTASDVSCVESLDERLMEVITDDNMDKYCKTGFHTDGKISGFISKIMGSEDLQKNMNIGDQRRTYSACQNNSSGETLKFVNGENHTNVLTSTEHEFSFKKDPVSNSKTSNIHSKLQFYSRRFNKIIPRMASLDTFTSFDAFSKMSGFGSYFKENVSDLQYFCTTHFKAIGFAACHVLLSENFYTNLIYQKRKSSMIIDFTWRLVLPIVLDYHQVLIQDSLSKSILKTPNLNLDKILSKYLKGLSVDDISSRAFSINRLYEKIIKLKLKNGNLHMSLLPNSSVHDTYPQDQNVSQSTQTDTRFPSVIKETVTSVLTPGSKPSLSFYSTPRSLEMDTIVPPERQPPTLLPSWNEYYRVDEKPIADRFGFIYGFRSKNNTSSPGLIESTETNNKSSSSCSEDSSYFKDLGHDKNETQKNSGLDNSYSKKGPSTSMNSLHKFMGIENKLLNYNGISPTLTSLSSDSSVAQGFITINMDEKSKGFAAKILLRSQLDTYSDDKVKQELWDSFLRKIQNEKKRTVNSSFYGYEGSELIGISGLGIAGKVGKQRWKEFRNLVIGGIPIVYRSKVWRECSGAYQLQQPGYYNDLLTMGKDIDPMVVVQIDMDIYRTMPNNVFFGGKGPGVHKLRNVLLAFSRHNTQIGYCQGMNVIAATLLLTHATEEEAFYVLVSIVENILPLHYFTPGLLASRADQRVLIRYVAELCPRIYDHFKKLSVDLEAVTFNWFLSVFTDCLPPEVLFRVFDLLFIEGNVYLFRVSIAIIKSKEKQILACASPASIYSLLKNLSLESFNIDPFIRATCENKKRIRVKDVMRYREIEIRKLKAEMDASILQEIADESFESR
ncbi:hypothetical protein PMAC_002031 [Pneumocystis sp. 'macacae']|nr:hypothetical protein PMAC_002031 [Pneumocystis sp. 'macacae']